MKARIAVAVSGGGRSLLNLLSCEDHHQFVVVGVIASNPKCGAIAIAENAGLPVFIRDFSSLNANLEEDLCSWMGALNVSFVALAGFLKRFPSLEGWERKIVNIHPALLPNFGGRGMYGEHVHVAVIKSGAKFSGASIHFVNERYDEGDIIAQAKVAINPEWTAQELAANVFSAECKLYPEVLDELVAGTLPLKHGVKIYEF